MEAGQMTVDRKRLRELAMAATPGDSRDANYAFMEAANPQTVLALLDALEAEQRDARRYRALRTSHITVFGRRWPERDADKLDATIDAALGCFGAAEQEERTFAAPTAPKEAT